MVPSGSRQPIQSLVRFEGLFPSSVHLDIKASFYQPENVLLYTPGRFPRLLIADFGYSQNSPPEGSSTSEGVAGTLAYLPPEAIKAIYDDRWVDYILVDCWSLGTVLHEIIA